MIIGKSALLRPGKDISHCFNYIQSSSYWDMIIYNKDSSAEMI